MDDTITLRDLDAPAKTQPRPPAKIDLKALALTRFGDWRSQAAALVSKWKDVAFATDTTKGYDEAKKALAEVRAPRYAAQNVSKESKSELAQVSKAVGAEEQAVIDALAATEAHIKAQIDAADARKAAEKAERERIEVERVAKHRQNIDTIRGYVAQAEGKTARQIGAAIDHIAALRDAYTDDGFKAYWQEFASEADGAWVATQVRLEQAHAQAVEAEAAAAAIEAQRVEQARIAAEQAERQRALDAQAAELKRQQEVLDAQEAATRFAAQLAAEKVKPDEQRSVIVESLLGSGLQAAERETERLVERAAATGIEMVRAVHNPPGTHSAPAAPAATMTLGQICERLRFTQLHKLLADLGFEGRTEGAITLYNASDFKSICGMLADHCYEVGEAS